MKKLLLCALLCAPVINSHAADAPPSVIAPQLNANQLAWKVALAVNDVEAARKLVAAPGFSPALIPEGWDKSLIYNALGFNRGAIAALMIERAPAEFFLSGKADIHNLGNRDNVPALRALLVRGGFDPNTRADKGKLTPLLEAANERNVAGVAALLADTRTDLNARNARGETALMLANSFAGAKEIVAMLLADKRCDVNALDNDGNSALHLDASELIATPALELLLLDPRAKINLKNKAGQTPLDIAAANNSRGAELILALRKVSIPAAMGARINAWRAEYGEAAPTANQTEWLRIIAANDFRAASKRVKRADFDPLLKVPGGDSLLDEALLREHSALALVMMDAAKTDDYLRDESPDSFVARTANLPVLLRFLSRADFNPNGTKNRDPLLITAIDDGNIEGVRALLKHPNIRPNTLDYLGGMGPFGALVTPRPNADKIAQLLLADSRIDPNFRYEDDGDTALQNLAWFARPDVLRVLVNNPRVEVNLANKRGETPLFMAASSGLENVKVLLDSGRVKIGPKEREAIDKKKAEWGISQSPLFDDAK